MLVILYVTLFWERNKKIHKNHCLVKLILLSLQKKITFTALTSTIDANTNEQIYRKSYERGSGSPLVVRLSCFLL